MKEDSTRHNTRLHSRGVNYGNLVVTTNAMIMSQRLITVIVP